MAAIKYGRLTPIRFVRWRRFPSGKRHAYWEFKCDCGKITTTLLPAAKSGHTRSCGCLLKEVRSAVHTVHGGCKGGKWDPIYTVWCGMLQRCNDENCRIYERYGNRGIRVSWESFAEFRKDMETTYRKGLQIERIDNSGNYEPGNCKWATRKEQARNKRSNINLTFNGKTQCISDWADEFGFNRMTLLYRYHAGWNTAQILTTPVL